MAQRFVRLTTSATNDLRSIRQYSKETWGPGRAAEYVQSIRDTFRSLGEFPELGPLLPNDPEVRRLIANKHAVYYRVLSRTVEILRVMHERAATPDQFD